MPPPPSKFVRHMTLRLLGDRQILLQICPYEEQNCPRVEVGTAPWRRAGEWSCRSSRSYPWLRMELSHHSFILRRLCCERKTPHTNSTTFLILHSVIYSLRLETPSYVDYQWWNGCIGKAGSSFVKFEVFTAVTMKNGVFWDVTPCGSCKNRHFGGT
jgi:hypothetical protein